MTDEHPDKGAGYENQNLDTERIVAEAPATGDARVDDAVAGLSRLAGRPAEEHVAILEEIHGQLRDILDDLGPEHAPAGGSGGGVPPGQT
jgi:acyl-CoA reductase-like NAD-dependent aldehyde dehydrogenase